MQRMAVDIARLHYKATSGLNRGWRRSRLGGNFGSHFYAWWAPSGAAPLKAGEAFDAPADAVFLRDIRHHDDHAPLMPGVFATDYLPLSVRDLRGEEYAPDPFTQPQTRFARARSAARILRGHPGSGKTTALLHAADASGATHVLYLTFSRELAALARDYFDRFCSAEKSFTVATYPDFIRGLQPWRPLIDDNEGRQRFRRDLVNHQRALGPWGAQTDALYDELHAHLAGAALPEACGRFPAAECMLLPGKAYRMLRERVLGSAAESALDAVRRLQKMSEEPLADRYFPDLAAAWRGAQTLTGKSSAGREIPHYGCIAVDEVQDLTPLEAFAVLALTRRSTLNGTRTVLLLAGDEAQTVRPTDFEWAWLNDMLHASVSQPQDFKLPANLRSPRRIAEVVNRTWDLYQYLEKRERPSGSGAAEVADDAPDQILYAALPKAELTTLLRDLSGHEGMALVAFDKASLPPEVHSLVLTPREAKGLDFHTVCVINGGRLLKAIVDVRLNQPADQLGRRLAIDQLRVALSRPTERLIWVDADPDAASVKEAGLLLDSMHAGGSPPMSVEALRACLDEGELVVEERVQRCQADARQFVSVKPDLAWSRANQAVALLDAAFDPRVVDTETRVSAYLCLAEVSFQLASRGKKLSPELGNRDLYEHAAAAAGLAGRNGLAATIRTIGRVNSGMGADRLTPLAWAIQSITESRDELPAWFLIELSGRAEGWLQELERHIEAGDNATTVNNILPPFFDAMAFPDAESRKQKLAQRSVQVLMKQRKYRAALTILESQPDANSKLIAECCEETADFGRAAAAYLKIGDRDKALRAYRSAADFTSALGLVRQIDDHPARKSLEWLAEMDQLVNRRPDNFGRVMLPAEKKLLEGVLERGLGVQKKKPAPRKKAATETAAKTTARKKAPARPKK
jgi:hypothetical protein